jgi:predicted transcriptional regulator
MPSFKVDLADDVAERLARRAEIAGLAPEALAACAVAEYLARNASAPTGSVEADPLAWLGRYGNEDAQSARIDDLLAGGFGA